MTVAHRSTLCLQRSPLLGARCSKRALLPASLLLCLLASLLLWADSATNLRPVADGASNDWTDTAGASCAATDCFDDVNEASGSTCSTTPSDGDTSYIRTATSGNIQTFDLDLSSVPNNSTLQSAVVYFCSRKEPAQGLNLVPRICIDGSCTEGSGQVQTQTFADYSATIDFTDANKTASTDFEVGVRPSASRAVRVSAIKIDLTFAPPSSNQPPLRRVIIARRLRRTVTLN